MSWPKLRWHDDRDGEVELYRTFLSASGLPSKSRRKLSTEQSCAIFRSTSARSLSLSGATSSGDGEDAEAMVQRQQSTSLLLLIDLSCVSMTEERK
jgi:hypothetical protein